LTQYDLAARTGIAQPTINRIERGHTTPHASTIRKLAVALGIDPAQLALGEAPDQLGPVNEKGGVN
jgi:transcriptional regulator with XRE-family HTH domain